MLQSTLYFLEGVVGRGGGGPGDLIGHEIFSKGATTHDTSLLKILQEE